LGGFFQGAYKYTDTVTQGGTSFAMGWVKNAPLGKDLSIGEGTARPLDIVSIGKGDGPSPPVRLGAVSARG